MYNLRDETDLRSLSSSKLDLRVVEFANNEGYALVSGGGESSEVLYVADNGKFDKEFYRENLEPHIQGYVIAYTCPVCGFIGSCIPNKCYLPSLPPNFVCPYRCENIFVCRHNPRRDSINQKSKFISFLTDTTCKVLRSKEKLLTTNWNLWKPFNLLTPKVRFKQDSVMREDRAAIGCNAVAIMQIMAYYQFPKVLNGETIPWKRFREVDNFYGEDSLLMGRAAKYVADEIKSMYGYKNSKHTAAYGDDVHDFMLKMGYRDYKEEYYNIDIIMDELDLNKPVLISGSRKGASAGHVWIIDGYKELLYTKQTDSVVYNFVHCNWGWGKDPQKQGYCFSKVFHSEQEYQHIDFVKFPKPTPHEKAYVNCTMFRGIKPKG